MSISLSHNRWNVNIKCENSLWKLIFEDYTINDVIPSLQFVYSWCRNKNKESIDQERKFITRYCLAAFNRSIARIHRKKRKEKGSGYLAPPYIARYSWWLVHWRGSRRDRSQVKTRPAELTGCPARPRGGYVGNRAAPARAGGLLPCPDRRRSRLYRCSRRGPCGSPGRSAARWWRVPMRPPYCPPRTCIRGTPRWAVTWLIDTRVGRGDCEIFQTLYFKGAKLYISNAKLHFIYDKRFFHCVSRFRLDSRKIHKNTNSVC